MYSDFRGHVPVSVYFLVNTLLEYSLSATSKTSQTLAKIVYKTRCQIWKLQYDNRNDAIGSTLPINY